MSERYEGSGEHCKCHRGTARDAIHERCCSVPSRHAVPVDGLPQPETATNTTPFYCDSRANC
jgi:hypothetical protein